MQKSKGAMMKNRTGKPEGFTLIELAVSIGILGILTLVVGTLFLQTVTTYTQLMSETDTNKQARYCLNMIARDWRESFTFDQRDVVVGTESQDALLLRSARLADNTFNRDEEDPATPGNPPPLDGIAYTHDGIESSIILFYFNTSPDGIPQLVRLQLFYASDLPPASYTPPFTLLSPNPYVGTDIVLVDSNGVQINVDRATGSTGVAGSPTIPPKILMNQALSFDIIDPNTLIPPEVPLGPFIVNLVCQYADRYGRTATMRVQTRIDQRNVHT
jgi:prepilin-type N-terminal cleavage/methylation domain-containing protein